MWKRHDLKSGLAVNKLLPDTRMESSALVNYVGENKHGTPIFNVYDISEKARLARIRIVSSAVVKN